MLGSCSDGKFSFKTEFTHHKDFQIRSGADHFLVRNKIGRPNLLKNEFNGWSKNYSYHHRNNVILKLNIANNPTILGNILSFV